MSSEAKGAEKQTTQVVVTSEAVQDVCKWLNLKMRTGRYSFGLAVELACHMVARCYHVHTIYDEIGILEGADNRSSQTKSAAPFEREPLIGFWHKHHFQTYFLIKNLKSEFEKTDIFETSVTKYIGLQTEMFAGPLT